MPKIIYALLCALMLVSAPANAAVIIITGDDIAAGSLPAWNASADPQAFLSKYDYGATTQVVTAGADTFLVLPMSTVPEPSAVLSVMLGLGIMGLAAHKQSKPFSNVRSGASGAPKP